MKIRNILGIAIILIFDAMVQRGYATIVPYSGLPNLVINSDFIATGTVSIKGVKAVLITDRILKGQVPREVTIVNIFEIHRFEAIFTENEKVLLFMKSMGGDSAYLTSDYWAKWPRKTIREYSNILDRASIAGVTGLVNEIFRIESETDINDRVEILKNWLGSSDVLLNLVALQYTLGFNIWSKEVPPDYETSIGRNVILKGLSEYAFKLIDSDSPLIRAESIRLLQFADQKRSLPILIEKITSPNKGVRAATKSVLTVISYEQKLDDNYKYDSNDSPEELLPVQRKWQEWYDNTDFDKRK
jgi:hypothetical protein